MRAGEQGRETKHINWYGECGALERWAISSFFPSLSSFLDPSLGRLAAEVPDMYDVPTIEPLEDMRVGLSTFLKQSVVQFVSSEYR